MKLKSNSSAKKRFKRTAGGKGKLVQRKSAKNHLLSHKSKRAKKLVDKAMDTSKTNLRRVEKTLPYL